MSQQQDRPSAAEEQQNTQERLHLIDTLKAPVIQMGQDLGCEVIENYELVQGLFM
jgi:hypothetical protein